MALSSKASNADHATAGPCPPDPVSLCSLRAPPWRPFACALRGDCRFADRTAPAFHDEPVGRPAISATGAVRAAKQETPTALTVACHSWRSFFREFLFFPGSLAALRCFMMYEHGRSTFGTSLHTQRTVAD